MSYLLIEQKYKNNHVKTWRLSSHDDILTIGQSKSAHIVTQDTAIRGIQGAFEFRSGSWWYINLDPEIKSLSKEELTTEICIDKPLEFAFNEVNLKVLPVKERESLFSKGHLFEKASAEKTAYELVVVKKGNVILETSVVGVGKKHQLDYEMQKAVVGLEVTTQTIYLDKNEDLKKKEKGEPLPKESKIPLFAVLGASVILALIIVFVPKPKHEVDIFEPKSPLVSFKNVKSAKQLKQLAEKKTVPQEPAPQTAGGREASGGGKAASVITSIRKTGLAHLISKVSAQAARSKNIVITQGQEAGKGPSSPALAALGKLKNGKSQDWGHGIGTQTGVSTVGKGGGSSGYSGMGTMSATGVGNSAGVGLIEDESEISGGLDREVIAQYIKTQLGQILYCYERRLSAKPDLFGKVAVKFTIGSSGEVETQKVNETSLRDSLVEGCILQRVAKWKFPKPEGGTKVVVTYPFLFKSTN